VANGTFAGVDEAKLWSMADALRNNMDAAEYKHVVLGLIFLKYISDAFEARHEFLRAAASRSGTASVNAISLSVNAIIRDRAFESGRHFGTQACSLDCCIGRGLPLRRRWSLSGTHLQLRFGPNWGIGKPPIDLSVRRARVPRRWYSLSELFFVDRFHELLDQSEQPFRILFLLGSLRLNAKD
jgi:hypothetical protein